MTDNATEKWIEIFRTGTHADVSGKTMTWSEADLDQVVANYDPAYHEAPACIGHPKHDKPAYGWFDRLKRQGQFLLGRVRQFDPGFVSAIAAGRYKKRSAAFYQMPGKGWYLRHVGFLGAAPPSVKGLSDVAFADDGRGEIVTVEYSERTVGGILRRLREWFIAQFGLETADRVLPGWEIDAMTEPPEPLETSPAYADKQPSEVDMSDETKVLQDRLDALATEKQRLEASYAESLARLTEENRTMKTTLRRAAIEAKLDELQSAGQVTPAMRSTGLAEFMAGLDEVTEVQYAEGTVVPPAAYFMRFLELLPKTALFVERATPRTAAQPAAQARSDEFGVDGKKSVLDPERAAMHQKILAYSQEKGVSYVVAAREMLK